MSVIMPDLDQAVLARRAEIVAALSAIVPGEGVVSAERAMRPFESDGLTAYKQLPMVVVLPETTDQVAKVLRYCHDNGVRVVPRGAGTSLSGGALPLADGVLLGMGNKLELWSEQAHHAQIRQTLGDGNISPQMMELRL